MFDLHRQFTRTLAETHALVKQKDSKGRPRPKRLRFHLFDGAGKKQNGPTADDAPTTQPMPGATSPVTAPAVVVSDYSKRDEGGLGLAAPDFANSRLRSSSVAGPALLSPVESEAEINRELSMKEAMAMLEGRPYKPTKPTIWQRIDKLEATTRSPLSVYAFKVTGAAMVFGALLWAQGSRLFFEKYSIAGSLLTIVVAL